MSLQWYMHDHQVYPVASQLEQSECAQPMGNRDTLFEKVDDVA